jgi:undecaprenyl diphosphate synthase
MVLSMSNEDIDQVPKHLGVIMDGNRRWSRANNVTYEQGYLRGIEVLRNIVRHAAKKGVNYITAYTFSNENWNRPKEEISLLMRILLIYLRQKVQELHAENIRLKVIGRVQEFIIELQDAIKNAVELTSKNTGITLTLAMNYGGRAEIVDAVNSAISLGKTTISLEDISQHTYDPGMLPVDLIIRTSGEERTSGFLLWKADYAELYFLQKNWPDISEKDIDEALVDYARRKRNFGA